MTATDEPLLAISRPPILVILVGLAHTVLGAVMTIALAFGCVLWARYLYLEPATLAHLTPSFLTPILGSLLGVPLSAVAAASGVWLLRGYPRGRRWTILLAYGNILLLFLIMVQIILWPDQLESQPAPGPLAACAKPLGFMTYWLFALIVMHLPSVRRFYAPPQPTAQAEEAAA